LRRERRRKSQERERESVQVRERERSRRRERVREWGPQEREKQGKGLCPFSGPLSTAPPTWGRSACRRPCGGAGRRRPPEEEGAAAPSTGSQGGCCPPATGRERGFAPLSGHAQGPRWAPGCPRPPATAGGAQDRGGSGHPESKRREKELNLGLCGDGFGDLVVLVVDWSWWWRN